MLSWALSKPCLSSEDQKSALPTGLWPSWIRSPCFPLLYCQHQIFRGKSKKSCSPLCKASLCSQIFKIQAARFLRQQRVLRAENCVSWRWWAFSLPLERSPCLGHPSPALCPQGNPSAFHCPQSQIPQHLPPPWEFVFLQGRDFSWRLNHDGNKTLFSSFSRQCLSLQSAIVSVSAGVTALIMGLTHSGRKVADRDRNSLNGVSMWLDQWV